MHNKHLSGKSYQSYEIKSLKAVNNITKDQKKPKGVSIENRRFIN